MPQSALRSRPSIDGTRLYYQSNRGELLCYELGTALGPGEPKLTWKIDLVKDLSVFKRDAGDGGNPLPAPLVVDDLVYCVTGNGSTFGYHDAFAKLPFVPKPDAPSFLAADKRTGRIIWSTNGPGKRIAYGQWGSPAVARVDGKDRILFPGGDARLYVYDPRKGDLLGTVDCNVRSDVPWGPRQRGNSLLFLSAPAVVGDTAYVGLNQDLETPASVRCPVMAIDLSAVGHDPSKGIRWSYTDRAFDGVVGPVAVANDCVFALSRSGMLVALDRATGRALWNRKLDGSAKFGGPVTHGGKLFVPAEDCLHVFASAREPMPVGRYRFDQQLMGSPVIAGGHLFVATSGSLWCLRLPN